MGWSLPFRAPLNEIFRNLLSNDEHDESFYFIFSSLLACVATLALEFTFNFLYLEQFRAPLNEIFRNLLSNDEHDESFSIFLARCLLSGLAEL
jgi:hypothetical protein